MSRFTTFLTAAAAACGILLCDVASTSARPPGGSRGGGGSSRGGSYRGSSYHGGGYHDDHHSGFSIGIGLGGYPGYYSGYRSNYYSPGTYYDGTTYVEPSYVEPSVVQPSEYVEPAQPGPAASTVGTRLRVILPDPNATVWFDGLQSTVSGNERIFEFSDEAAGKAYLHKVKAAWRGPDGKSMSQEREVRVQGGTAAVVDFRRAVGGPPASPE